MLYKSKYNSITLGQIEYNNDTECFQLKMGTLKVIYETKNKICLCLDRKQQEQPYIKLLVDNKVGWIYEHFFERLS